MDSLAQATGLEPEEVRVALAGLTASGEVWDLTGIGGWQWAGPKLEAAVLQAMATAPAATWSTADLERATGLVFLQVQVALSALTDTKKVKAQTGGWHLA